MENRNVVTYLWSESKSVFTAILNRGKKASCFNEFIFSYPLPKDKLFTSLMKVSENYKLNDVTNTTLLTEDSVLFDASTDSMLDVVVSHLHVLNTGGRVKGMWCYLDTEKKAVVHFINKKGWYAELFVLCDEDFSALHLVNDANNKVFIPVTFKKDISQEKKMVSVAGGEILYHYLPRVTMEFLGKNGTKKGKFPKGKEKASPVPQGRDKEDSL